MNGNVLSSVATIAASLAALALIVQVSRGSKQVGKVVESINPASEENVLAKATNRLTADISGVPNRTFGQAIFKFFNPSEAKELCQAGVPELCDREEGNKTARTAEVARDRLFLNEGDLQG